MTVKQLIEALQTCNPDDLVVLARDAEGNSFSPVDRVLGDDMYEPESSWSGCIKLRELTPELEKQGYSEDDVGDPEEGAVNCVTLWPVY